MKKLSRFRFYIEYYHADRITYEFKDCKDPRLTKAWKHLRTVFNTDQSVTGIGYEKLSTLA